ncbi:MAG: hypothetical protein E7596_08815 [Ruminococcaceae bacterium]|nr:hypothetical protein [Oscillospiraceae bacterium]
MKKKLFLMVVMTFLFVLALAFAVSAEAESVHNANTVDYRATVTLNDGVVLPLYDTNHNALIWYIDGKDENGKTIYSSVCADDSSRVTWKAESWDEVQSWDALLEDGKTSIKSKIVVINLMDDDVIRNTGNAKFLNKPMDNFKRLFEGMKNLEYCYLRLDTRAINTHSFSGCSKLKYINLEDLTQLKRMAQSSQFSGCTSLFDGQVLDLTRTQLYEFEGSSTFSGVPFKGVKFPETMAKVGSGTTFNNCTKLEFVSIGNKARFYGTPFSGCTSLKAIYYVGTLDELTASIGSSVIPATTKSYAEYRALPDKSGVYAVYNYSRCEAFSNGVHGEATVKNDCVDICNVCGTYIVNHVDGNTSVVINYSNYSLSGEKVTACQCEGCTYKVTEEAPAIFTCLGYSAPENGTGGIAIGYTVNNEAIKEYTEATGKTLKYGVFAVLQDRLGDKDVFSEDGTVAEGVINAEITNYEFVAFELKIVGFTDAQKDTKLAMGAYVAVTNGEITEYSYMQGGEPNENEKYCFVSYNDIVGNPSSDKETAQ